MTSTHTSLDTSLGLALVPYYSPKHHPRAARLLDSVLTSHPNNASALFARAQIHQAALEWEKARESLHKVLDMAGAASASFESLTDAREEIGWCLVNEGSLEAGSQVLEETLGIRNEVGGDSEKAILGRARTAWRLGRTQWKENSELVAELSKICTDWQLRSLALRPRLISFPPSRHYLLSLPRIRLLASATTPPALPAPKVHSSVIRRHSSLMPPRQRRPSGEIPSLGCWSCSD